MHYIQQDAFSYTHKPMELSPWSRVDIHPHLPNSLCFLEFVRRAFCTRFTCLTHFKCVLEFCWLAAACCRVHPQNWLVLHGWDFTVAEQQSPLTALTPGNRSMHHPYESHYCRYQCWSLGDWLILLSRVLPKLMKVVTNGATVFVFNAKSHLVVKLPCIDFQNVLKLRKLRSGLEKDSFETGIVSFSALEDIYSWPRHKVVSCLVFSKSAFPSES